MATVSGDLSLAREAALSLLSAGQLGEGDTAVLDVEVAQREDEIGDLGWWITLLLPQPTTGRWNVEATSKLKRQVREWFDELADNRGWSLTGSTVVVVSALDEPDDDADASEDELPDGAGATTPERVTH